MKVFVIGANGQIGKQIVQLLQNDNNHSVRAMVRNEEQLMELKEQKIEAVLGNLEESVQEIAEAMKGSDAVIFTAGSGGQTGLDKTLLVDLDGAVKSMEAAEQAGVDRYIMVSAIQSSNRDSWATSPIKPYMVAKHYADRELLRTNLNYTIVRPGLLTNEEGTGKIMAQENLDRDSIPREDVAKTVLAVLDEPNTYKKTFDLVQGETTIADALKDL